MTTALVAFFKPFILLLVLLAIWPIEKLIWRMTRDTPRLRAVLFKRIW